MNAELHPTPRARSELSVAFAVYLAATLVQVWPLVRDLFGQLPSDPGDPARRAEPASPARVLS